jgi:hypothetical protein
MNDHMLKKDEFKYQYILHIDSISKHSYYCRGAIKCSGLLTKFM